MVDHGTIAAVPCRLGVLAFGDSITNGGGELQWGVALQSWASWVARALGLPFTNYAVDGARVDGVVAEQIAAFEARAADPDARYDLGCLYIGVNDVRDPGWDPVAYDRGYRRALAFLRSRCDRLVTLTVPLDLGRPRAGAKVIGANEIIRRASGEAGALVVALDDFSGRNLLMADHVHPTAFGQIAIAGRALAVLAQDDVVVRVAPHTLISYETTWIRRLHHDLIFAYRHAKVSLRALWIVLALALATRRSR